MNAIEVAREFIGQKEKPNNGGFYNPRLQKLMDKAKHKEGEAWCCYFAEAVFCEAYPEREEELRELFSANCVQTAKNFEAAGYDVGLIPVEGALVIWQRFVNGRPTTSGHAGILEIAQNNTSFISIEGNTNEAGSREGELVLPKSRTTNRVATGLNVIAIIDISKGPVCKN